MHMHAVWCCDAVWCSSPSSLSSNTGLLDELFAPILFFHLPQWNIDALLSFLSARRRLMLLGVSETRCDDDYRCRDSHTESRSCSNWLCVCVWVCVCVCVWAPAAATISTSPPSSRARARATNMFHISLPRCDIKERKHVCYVNLQHKYIHNGIFHEIESYASSERWINHISIDVWFGQYLKIWNLRVQKNLNIEKIIFKVVLCNAYY